MSDIDQSTTTATAGQALYEGGRPELMSPPRPQWSALSTEVRDRWEQIAERIATENAESV